MRTDLLSKRLVAAGMILAFTNFPSFGSEEAGPAFSILDGDHDGNISRVEYSQAALRRVFEKLDVNGNQVITIDEWKSADTSPTSEADFQSLDEDGDGQVTVVEFLSRAWGHSNLDAMFGELDKDGDSLISQNEWANSPTTTPALKIFSIQF